MTKEELKALGLTDEQIVKVIEDYGKNYVSKSQFNEKNEALKFEKEERGKLSKEIETLKKSNKDNEALIKQIEDLQSAAKDREKTYQGELTKMKFDMALERSLTSAKARNIKAVRALLDLKDLKLDDKGEIQGLNDRVEALKKSDAYLFENESKPKISGITPFEGSNDNEESSMQSQIEAALGI